MTVTKCNVFPFIIAISETVTYNSWYKTKYLSINS